MTPQDRIAEVGRERYGAPATTAPANPFRAAMENQGGGEAAPDLREQEAGSILGRVGRYAADLGGQAMQGLTLGFADELDAGTEAAIASVTGSGGFSETYDRELAANRAREKEFKQNSPVAAALAEAAGAVPTMLIPAGAATGTARSMAGRMVRGGTAGAATGGVYGFGQGEGGPGDRLESAALPAAAGGVIGGAVPAVGRAVGRGVEAIARRRAASRGGVQPETEGILRETIQADMAGAPARLATAGPDAMQADMGPNARALLDVAIQRSGPAGQRARAAIDDRVSVASGRVRDTLDDNLGRPEGLRTIERGLKAKSQPEVGAAYREAYDSPISYADETGQAIEQIVKERVPLKAIRRANELMRAEGQKSRQIKATVDDDGNVAFESMPDVRQIDYITRGLNEVAEREAGKGRLGGQTQTGRAYGNLSAELRSLTREAVPEYGRALNLAADPIRARNATKTGYDALGKMRRDELAEAIEGMSEAERRHAAQGVREAIDDNMSKVQAAFTDPNTDAREAAKALKELSSRSNRDKIQMIVGPERAKRLFDTLDEAAVAFELKSAVAENSKTFARTALESRVGRRTDDSALDALSRAEPIQAAKRTLAHAMGGNAAARDARADAVYSDLVDFLTAPGNMSRPAAVTGGQAPADLGAFADRATTRGAGASLLAFTGQQPERR